MTHPFSTSIRRRRLLQVASGSIIAAPFMAWSQGLSSSPIRIIVSFPPGGSTDVLARVLAQNVAPALGQTVIIENRVGSGGAISIDAVAQSPGDGHTLLFSSLAPLVLRPWLAPQAPPNRSFSPVGTFAYIPQVLASTRHNSFSATSRLWQ
jgi:tripartite-type tricarboxylate transporter receptor subunit TctC